MLFHMYQVFSSLQGHLHFFVHFFFTFMEHFFIVHPIFQLLALLSWCWKTVIYCIINSFIHSVIHDSKVDLRRISITESRTKNFESVHQGQLIVSLMRRGQRDFSGNKLDIMRNVEQIVIDREGTLRKLKQLEFLSSVDEAIDGSVG